MNDLLQSLRTLGYARLAVLAAVGVGMMAFFIFLLVRFNNPDYAPLYAEISPDDTGAIVQALDSAGIPYRATPSGTGIEVPRDRLGQARMTLAAGGLPSGGSAGWKLLDNRNMLGTTESEFQMLKQRALEGELQRSIETLAPVKAARVQLVMPTREIFSTEQQPPSASVVVTLKGGAALSQEQVSAIAHLVAGAVPSMRPGNISIIDQAGRLLKSAEAGEDSAGIINDRNSERRRDFERRLANDIEHLLTPTLGAGKARVMVTADMDFDRVSRTAEEFNPEQQVLRSSQTVTDKQSSQDGGEQPVTVNTNLPGGQPTGAGAAAGSRTSGDRNEETNNYEISRVVTSTMRDGGAVRKLSVAVTVDGTTTTNDAGEATYAPLPAEQLADIDRLVKAAMGFDAARGDVVQVVNQRFASGPVAAAESDDMILGFPRDQLISLAQTAVTGLVILLALLLVVRPIVTKALTAPAAGNIVLADGSLAGGDGLGTITIPGGAAGINMPPGMMVAGMASGMAPGVNPMAGNSALAQAMSASGEPDTESQIDQMINLTQVEGRVRASSLRKIGDIIDKHPDEAVSILRNWMYQEQPQG